MLATSNTLYAQFLTLENFHLAWQAVAKNHGCAGVDGETIDHFTLKIEQYLSALQAAVIDQTYRPLPLRQILIPKKAGGLRELGVPTVRDRIVQQALLNVLYPVLEAQFEPCSFAYRPGRSHLMAVERVAHWRDRGYCHVLEADIEKYFDEISHDRLLTELRERVDEPRILALIQPWITAPILTRAGLVLRNKGVPQGAVISPILANVYLDDLDEALTGLDLKVVRFADDFVVLAKTEERITQAKQEVLEQLTAHGLKLNLEKTRITNFEEGFRFLGHVFVRDLIVKSSKQRQDAANRNKEGSELILRHCDPVTQPTAMQKAIVEALRDSQQPIPPPLFVVLGYQVRGQQSVHIESKEQVWGEEMTTLYLVQQGMTVKREQDQVVLNSPKEAELRVPLRQIDQILVFGNVQLTTPVISACLEAEIPIVFLTQMGEYKGHLWSAEATNLTIQTAQFARSQEESFRLAIARSIVQAKLWNSKQFLLKLNRKRQLPGVVAAIKGLAQAIEAVEQPENSQTLDQIRGYEGSGAARYFSALSQLIVHPDFTFSQRVFYPPTDPVNSLLSFGYTLLLNNVFSLLLAEGLNPYLGNLHGAERQKAYLAFDLMEEFRSPIVDTLVIKLINQKVLQPTDFSWATEEGGIYLVEPARRLFLKHFEERISSATSHPDVQGQISYRRVIQLQVKRYVKAVLGNNGYQGFRRTV